MEMSQAIRALSALSQETRLAAFRLLVQAGPDGRAAGEISEALSVPPATLSFHLSHLANAGLAELRRNGRSIIYRANYEAMNELMTYLTENCCESAGGCAVPACATDETAPPKREVSSR
jgi:ArsR family transcriptional regulator